MINNANTFSFKLFKNLDNKYIILKGYYDFNGNFISENNNNLNEYKKIKFNNKDWLNIIKKIYISDEFTLKYVEFDDLGENDIEELEIHQEFNIMLNNLNDGQCTFEDFSDYFTELYEIDDNNFNLWFLKISNNKYNYYFNLLKNYNLNVDKFNNYCNKLNYFDDFIKLLNK